MFNELEFAEMARLVFSDDYPGYRPNVIEAPNGDGNLDVEKQYAHIAPKYHRDGALDVLNMLSFLETPLGKFYQRAHHKAVEAAVDLGIPPDFFPDARYGALRVIQYPPGAITHPHKDFNLLTLMCYRNDPGRFQYVGPDQAVRDANDKYPQIHFGEILEKIIPAMSATTHQVLARQGGKWQYSIVYFAIPDHATVLPEGITVGEWLKERIARSRYEK